MVKQYSLFESFNRFVRKLSKYSPEERKRIVDRLIKLGKGNGGIYSADEYGRRMIDGQIKRARNIAKLNNRKLNITTTNDWRNSVTVPATDIRLHKRPSSNWDGIDPEQIRQYRNSVRGIDSIVIPSLNSKTSKLNLADVTSHEVDEYSTLFRNSKKLGIKPSLTNRLTTFHNQTNPGKHEIGVLGREFRRRNKLSLIYNEQFPVRDKIELSHNSIKLKDLLKYMGSIRDKEKEILQSDKKPDILSILRKQKEVIEDFIRRKVEISKMENGFIKKLKTQTLRDDINRYNMSLDGNRRRLDFNL